MHGNVTTAAWIFGISLVLASLLLLVGVFVIVERTTARVETNARHHAAAIERAGAQAGDAFGESFDNLVRIVDERLMVAIEAHGRSIERAGDTVGEAFDDPLQVSVATPRQSPLTVQVARPLTLEQPVVIEGTIGEDRSLSVQASIFE